MGRRPGPSFQKHLLHPIAARAQSARQNRPRHHPRRQILRPRRSHHQTRLRQTRPPTRTRTPPLQLSCVEWPYSLPCHSPAHSLPDTPTRRHSDTSPSPQRREQPHGPHHLPVRAFYRRRYENYSWTNWTRDIDADLGLHNRASWKSLWRVRRRISPSVLRRRPVRVSVLSSPVRSRPLLAIITDIRRQKKEPPL